MSFVSGEHTNWFHVKLVGVICVHAHTHLLICNTHVQLTTLFFLSPWKFMRYNRHCVCSLCSILYCFHFLFFGSYYDQNENWKIRRTRDFSAFRKFTNENEVEIEGTEINMPKTPKTSRDWIWSNPNPILPFCAVVIRKSIMKWICS